MRRKTKWLSAWVTGVAVALAVPAAGQQQDQQEPETPQQQQQQPQPDDQQSSPQEAAPAQPQADEQPQSPERSQQTPAESQRGEEAQPQQQQQQEQEQQRRAMLGVAFAADSRSTGESQTQPDQNDAQQATQQGLEIVAIMPDSAAEQANLQRGDRILSIDGREVRSAEEIDRMIEQKSVGDSLDLVILRNNEQQQMQVTLQAAPQRQRQQRSQRPDFDRGARASRGWLGVTLDTRAQGQGVTINRVYPAGPAARAGLRQGDRILQVTGQQVSDYEDVLQALDQAQPGDSVELMVSSNGQQQQVSVRLDDASVFSSGADEFDSRTMWRDSSGRTGAIPEHDMMLEQHRRFAEQHERIENLLLEVQRDIQAIRQQLNGQPAGASGEAPAQPSGETPAQPSQDQSSPPREGQATQDSQRDSQPDSQQEPQTPPAP